MIFVLGCCTKYCVKCRKDSLLDQNLGGSGSDRRTVILCNGPVGGVSNAGEGNEANALLKTEYGHLLGISESVELCGDQPLATPAFAGEDLVVDLVSQRVLHGE